MMDRAAVVEIERRDDVYRVELRDRETGAAIDDAVIDDVDGSTGAYKHVCKVRLPAEGEPRISLESDTGETRIVLRAGGRTCYRHELPPAAN